MSVEAPEATFACPRCGAEYTGGDACPSCGFLRGPIPCDDDPSRNAVFRCVLCGRTACGADPGGTQPARCDLHAHVPIIEGWAQVYTTSDEIEGGLIVENLKAEGTDAQLYSQRDDHVFPMDLGEMAIVRVLVPVWQFSEAMELVQSYSSDEGEVSFACSNCGEAYDAGATLCASCGARLDDGTGGTEPLDDRGGAAPLDDRGHAPLSGVDDDVTLGGGDVTIIKEVRPQ
ncbi:MAG TPA: hypothetical protein VGC13_28565 [Longimicrobium sp.]|uniref:hypothetical protein n=1 Tax=Longimicrobium sp. TaxID=2029185 RepID=UPI002EDA9B2F